MVEFLKSADGEALWGDGLAMLLTAPPRQSALAAVGEVQAVLTADQGEASEVVKLSEGIYIVNPSGWGSLYIGFWPSLLVISHAKIRIANKITDIAADDNFSMLTLVPWWLRIKEPFSYVSMFNYLGGPARSLVFWRLF